MAAPDSNDKNGDRVQSAARLANLPEIKLKAKA
jgi:hypothetical protein